MHLCGVTEVCETIFIFSCGSYYQKLREPLEQHKQKVYYIKEARTLNRKAGDYTPSCPE